MAGQKTKAVNYIVYTRIERTLEYRSLISNAMPSALLKKKNACRFGG